MIGLLLRMILLLNVHRIKWMSTLVILCIAMTSHSQKDLQVSFVIKDNLTIIPLPFVGFTPSTGFLGGIAAGANWYMGDKETTMMSTSLSSITYTQKKQWLFIVRANTFFEGDKWNMLSDLRFLINSEPTYGLGTGPQSAKPVSNGFIEYTDEPFQPIPDEQMMEFKYLRIHNIMMRRKEGSRWFAGFGYHLDYHYKIDDHLLNLDTTPQVRTSHFVYNRELGFNATTYATSGVSLNILLDSRDNAINPYSGRYAFASLRVNGQFLGSNKNSSLLWLEYRDYLTLSEKRPRHLLGFWTFGWFVTSGDVPYLDLPALGWDQFSRSGRAYKQGRFRGEDFMYVETEYRFPLQKNKDRWGGVLFVNGFTASNRLAGIDPFQYINAGYGAGIRFMLDNKTRTNINIDYAIGQYGSQGFYLGINEVF